MKKPPVTGRPAGFTLIELLIVIAVIAILAAILFPVFARARENARRTSCLSNMKQMGLAIMQYTQDFDEKFPLRWVNVPGETGWVTQVQSYAGSTQLFQCPSELKKPPASPTSDGYTDYCSNSSMFPNPDPGQTGISLTQLKHPVSTFLVLEVDDSIPSGSTSAKCSARYDDWNFWDDGSADMTLPPKKYKIRHLAGSNWLFSDGHAKWLHPDRISNSAATGANYTFGL